jgi:1,2-diacylglycerol-3-alpha-glucose alpha-1,2-galactosyltransferase
MVPGCAPAGDLRHTEMGMENIPLSSLQGMGWRMRVRVISESQFTVTGHGVHTAFLEHVNYLGSCDEVQLNVNGRPSRTPDLLHVHTVGPYALMLLVSTRAVRIVTAHLLPESLTGSIVGAPCIKQLARRYFPWFYNRADVVIAVSNHVKAALLDLGVRKPIFVLANSVDVSSISKVRASRDAVRRRLGLSREDVLVVSVGQLQPRKGVLEFLRCAARLRNVKFAWIGGPIFGIASSARTGLYRAVNSAPTNFSYTGPISRDNVFEYLGAADIYLSLSMQETFGIAALEAAAAGLPLILSDIPAFHETYGDAAQFVGQGDAVPVISALTGDAQARATWGERAREVALRYERALVGGILLSLYSESLDHLIQPP